MDPLASHQTLKSYFHLVFASITPARHQVNDLATAHRCSNLSRMEGRGGAVRTECLWISPSAVESGHQPRLRFEVSPQEASDA